MIASLLWVLACFALFAGAAILLVVAGDWIRWLARAGRR